MDDGSEIQKAKWVIVFGLVFLISGYFALNEVRYMVFATSAEAQVMRVYQTVDYGRRGRRIPKLGVEYQFTDKSGASVTAKNSVNVETVIPEGASIRVEYIAGVKDSSRIIGAGNAAWPIGGFVLSCLGLTFFIVKLAREANEPIKTTRKKHR